MVQMLIEECVEQSILKALDGASNKEVMNTLLEHTDQRFRLFFMLGRWKELNDTLDEEQDDYVDADSDIEQDEVSESDPFRDLHLMNKLSGLLTKIRELAKTIRHHLQSDFEESDVNNYNISVDYQEAASGLINQSHLFHEIVASIMSDVKECFSYIQNGVLHCDQVGLPRSWSFSTPNRSEFLKSLRTFTGNNHHFYGRLLTPLVAEIKISGPFFVGDQREPQNNLLNLIDTLGIGHTAKHSSSESTSHIISELDRLDGILIVDNATQATRQDFIDLLSVIATNGHLEKVLIAFTHMDQVVGPNFADSEDRKRHVFRSLQSAVASLKETNNLGVIRDFEKILETRTFFFGNLHESSKKHAGSKNQQLEKLFLAMRKASRRADSINIPIPVYSLVDFEMCIEESTIILLKKWKSRLGLDYEEGIRKEHWATIKALCRRIGNKMCDSYKNLDPSGDFSRVLMTGISNRLENPISWISGSDDYVGQNVAINNLRQRISPGIQGLSRRRIISDQLADWKEALEINGSGSSIRRACQMDFMFHQAAPSILSPKSRISSSLRAEVIKIIETELTRVGGVLKTRA